MVSWAEPATLNITNFTGIFWSANEATGFWFGTAILFCVWTVLFISFIYKRGADESLLAASFLTGMLSWLLRVIGIVGDRDVVILIVMTVLSILILFRKRLGGSN